MGNVLVAAILAVVVGLIVRGMILDKKSGRSCSGCSGACGSCGSGSACSGHTGCGHGTCDDPGQTFDKQPLKEFHMR